MRTYTALIVLLLLPLFVSSCSDKEETERKLHRMCEEIQGDLLTNVLPFWALYSPDPAGGFYGTIRNDGLPVPEADKGLVLNARILWTFSSAYRAFEVENYKQLADRAQKYIIEYFLDPEYGGAYWLLNADGIPLDTNKQTYGIAFAIYALSEHYRATGNKESLEQAIALYNTLQEHAYDAVNGGYIDSFTRNWQLPERFGYDGQGIAPKTMNTHLHILEAFTNLYRVWPDKQLKKQLKRLVNLFYDEIINPDTHHQRLYFTMEWNSLDKTDSYGHDIELSWLLCEAAKITGDDRLIERTKQMAITLVDTQIKEGWSPQGYMYYEKSNGAISKNIEWWPQAEAVVGLINAWQLSNDPGYATTAIVTWRWIKENLIDSEYGEWYYRLDENLLPITTLPKADRWKCPYHNSRMAFETIERIRWLPRQK
jgi:mannobiose 2-epimerase